MELTVNGITKNTGADITLAGLMDDMGIKHVASGIAAAVNGAVVPRERWSDTALCEGDDIEIISAVQGG